MSLVSDWIMTGAGTSPPPDPELLRLELRDWRRMPFKVVSRIKFVQLEVGKVGLPPLFNGSIRKPIAK